MAFAYDGAWAEYTVAQAVGLTPVPDNVPLEQAAILADAVSTPFGAVVRTGQVAIGESVGVWGVGGIGTHIVQSPGWSARCRSSPSTSSPQCSTAPSNSAPITRSTRATRAADKIAEVTGGRILDVAFDAVGLKSTFEQALDVSPSAAAWWPSE